jgi:hypothetical protein
MTLKYMQGFETMRDDTDYLLQGWTRVSGPRSSFVPSISAVAGTSMHTLGTFTASAVAPGAAGATDPGYFNTGVTVNQAWLAGGFSFGAFAKVNGGVAAAYGSGSAINCNQACFDGTKYWAIQYNAGAYNVATSPDLINWTVTTAQPTALGAASSIFALGGGIIGVYGSTAASTSYTVYYTNNAGTSWSNYSLGTITSAVSDGVGISTGNSSFPHAVYSFAATGSLYVGTVGVSMASVATSSAASQNTVARPKITSGLITFIAANSSSGTIFSATASNASLNTAGAWTTATFTTVTSPTDLAYNPTSNTWVISSSLGIHSFPNAGAAGTPLAPSGALTLTPRYSTVGIQNVFWNGTQLVGIGLQGHIITSPDGVVWTEQGQHLIPVGTSGYDWRCSINDGTRYVLFSDATNGIVATTPDLVTNYQAQYVMESARASASNNYGIFGLYSGTAPSSTGLWTVTANSFGYNASVPSGGSMTVTMSATVTNYATFTVSTATTLSHYYEMVFTPVAGTANTFSVNVYVDGTLVQSYASVPMAASTSDTTSLLIISLDRRGAFTAYDDMYFNVQDGVGLSGQLGPINIIARRPTTDVQDQWVKTGSAASNALSVNQPALSSQSTNYVTSANAGDKDIYTSNTTIPAGYVAKAVQLEAMVARTSSTVATVNIGLISGTTEVDSANVALGANTATYVAQVYQMDPNGNKAWTNAAVVAAEMVANHVS